MSQTTVEAGQQWKSKRGQRVIRVMAVTEGYAMVRTPRSMPYVLPVELILSDFRPVRPRTEETITRD